MKNEVVRRPTCKAAVGRALLPAAFAVLLQFGAGCITARFGERTTALGSDHPGVTTEPQRLRWMDVLDHPYADAYRDAYDYRQARVTVTYSATSPVLTCRLGARNLKPNFAYQIKLNGSPELPGNEGLGLAGRWWQEAWNGTRWVGANLNSKGNGSRDTPNNATYLANRDVSDASSPTGKKYRHVGYVIFGYFLTDDQGRADGILPVDSSYHVLFKTSQRARQPDDGPALDAEFSVDASQNPAYDADYPTGRASVYGEWEHRPCGGVRLDPGTYACEVVITEESFHGGKPLTGNWAPVLAGDVRFTITPAAPDALTRRPPR